LSHAQAKAGAGSGIARRHADLTASRVAVGTFAALGAYSTKTLAVAKRALVGDVAFNQASEGGTKRLANRDPVASRMGDRRVGDAWQSAIARHDGPE